MVPSCTCTSAAWEGGVPSAWMTRVTAKAAAAIEAKTADVRNPGRMHPPEGRGTTRARIQEPRPGVRRPADAGRYAGRYVGIMYRRGGFRKAKSISAGVLLDRHA